MVEKNASDSIGGGFLNRVAQGLSDSAGCLLLPWKDPYPLVRNFVLGQGVENGDTLCGRIVLDRTPREIRVQFQLLEFGYVARYTDRDFESCLERADNDLDLGSVPWEPTFDQQRKDKQKRALTK